MGLLFKPDFLVRIVDYFPLPVGASSSSRHLMPGRALSSSCGVAFQARFLTAVFSLSCGSESTQHARPACCQINAACACGMLPNQRQMRRVPYARSALILLFGIWRVCNPDTSRGQSTPTRESTPTAVTHVFGIDR